MAFPDRRKNQEATMKTVRANPADSARSAPAVRAMLRDIGYALWLSRKLAAAIEAERSRPLRPEMSEFCAVDAAGMAA
jgi:hypothetical protein